LTKQNPEKLCASCLRFDKQFESGNVRLDISTVCECNEETLEEFYDRMRERDIQIPSDLTYNEMYCDETTQTTNENE
jgi:hypothetical protein